MRPKRFEIIKRGLLPDQQFPTRLQYVDKVKEHNFSKQTENLPGSAVAGIPFGNHSSKTKLQSIPRFPMKRRQHDYPKTCS